MWIPPRNQATKTHKCLDAAFRATSYRIETASGVFDLRVGQRNPAFSAFLRANGRSNWTVITAFNPGARLVDDRVNAVAHARLAAWIHQAGWESCPACNIDPAGVWPDEPGFCLFDVADAELDALARTFGQRAVLSGDIDATPDVRWMTET